MNDLRNAVKAIPALVEALGFLRNFRKEGPRPPSLADLAEMLRNSSIPEFSLVEKSAIHRWLNYGDTDLIDAKTSARIIRAAQFIRDGKERPHEINFMVIGSAPAEALPILLLKSKEIKIHQHFASVDVFHADNVQKAFKALANGYDGKTIHAAIAPREDRALREFDSLRRFFKITTVSVAGLFPFENNGPRDFANKIVACSNTAAGIAIGYLRNANYGALVRDLINSYRLSWTNLRFEPVDGSREAVSLLDKNEIQAVVGHPVFVENCRRNATPPVPLYEAGSGMLNPVKMDVFLNIKNKNEETARLCLHLIYDAVTYINDNKESENFRASVNKLLNLGDMKISPGNHVLDKFVYEVKTFEADTLVAVWARETDRKPVVDGKALG